MTKTMELRDIAGFPGYKVSDEGRVWSEKRQKWLAGVPDKKGYLVVNLYVDGKLHTKKIHRLVAHAFIPNPDNLPEVNHKNEIKTDNRAANLEWSTSEYNINYGSHNAKMKATQQRLYGKPVVQLSLDGREVARFCCAMEAERQTGISQGGISMVCTGRAKTFKGYRWQYLPKEA